MTNMVGNCVATVVIARWEKEFDGATAARVLNGEMATIPVPRVDVSKEPGVQHPKPLIPSP